MIQDQSNHRKRRKHNQRMNKLTTLFALMILLYLKQNHLFIVIKYLLIKRNKKQKKNKQVKRVIIIAISGIYQAFKIVLMPTQKKMSIITSLKMKIIIITLTTMIKARVLLQIILVHLESSNKRIMKFKLIKFLLFHK